MVTVTPQEQILGVVNNHWQGCCVGAAAQLQLADLLADGPLHVGVTIWISRLRGPGVRRIGERAWPM